jgi:hypothetical protein
VIPNKVRDPMHPLVTSGLAASFRHEPPEPYVDAESAR